MRTIEDILKELASKIRETVGKDLNIAVVVHDPPRIFVQWYNCDKSHAKLLFAEAIRVIHEAKEEMAQA